MPEFVPLAVDTDVANTLGRDLTTEEARRVTGILAKASELFRLEARQQFTPGTSTVRLQVVGGEIHLPEKPVNTVTSVVDDCGNSVTYTRRDGASILRTTLGSDRFVTVTYTHGDDEVPELVKQTVAEIAAKVLSVPDAARTGVARSTETKGPFSTTLEYATWAQGGQTMLAPDDRAIARRFRPRRQRIIVQSAPTAAGPAFGSQLPGLP